MNKRVISEYFEEIRDCLLNNKEHLRYDYQRLVLSKSKSDITFTFLPLGENKVEIECTRRPIQQPTTITLLKSVTEFDDKTYELIVECYNSVKSRYEEIDRCHKVSQLADLLYKFTIRK